MRLPRRLTVLAAGLAVALGGTASAPAAELVEGVQVDRPDAGPAAEVATAGVAPGSVEILYHADLDGRVAAPRCGSAGARSPDYAALAGALVAARAAAEADRRPPPLILAGGNQAGPDPLLERSEAGLRTLAALLARGRYDAVALGHQELSLGSGLLEGWLGALAGSGLPVVATNLRCAPERRATCAATRGELIVRRSDAAVGSAVGSTVGSAVGILATISPSVLAGIPAAARAGLSLEDPATLARAGARRLRALGATTVVLMTQGPRDARALDEIDTLERRLGGGPAAEAIDLILAGGLADSETDRPLRLLRRDDSPPVVGSTVGAAHGLSRATLAAGAVSVEPLAAGAPASSDPAAEALLAPVVAAYCARYGVAVAPAPLRGLLTREAFIDYVLQVMRRRAGAEIALVNRAFVKRAAFPLQGVLTRADLLRAIPYDAVLGRARLTGAAVESALGPALANPKLAALGLGRGPGGGLQVNGRDLDRTRQYRVATIGFVAGGGDAILPPGALALRPLAGAPDVRGAVEAFLRGETAVEDGDPTVDPRTDFGPPPSRRLLLVGLTDLGFDLSDTTIRNAPAYGDTQLARAQQTSLKGQATFVAQLRHPVHEADGTFDVKYGWTRNQPATGAAVSSETADLVTFTVVYNFRGLRGLRAVPRLAVPDPYVRVWIESELTRPAVTPTQTRDYHHLEMTDTVGALFTLSPKLKIRGGGGLRKELVAEGTPGRVRALLEAGAALSPVALATLGPAAVRLEGTADYNFVDPGDAREHQLRGSARLAVPLVPFLFLTAGLDAFAVQRRALGWGASFDTTIGLRVHVDRAYQRL